jgi:hypothetical protein
LGLTALASLGAAALVLQFELLPALLWLTWAGVAAIAWQPRLGLYLAFGLVLVFEPGVADPLMLPGTYLHGGLSSLIGLSGAIASPLELLLVLTFLVWIGQVVLRRGAGLRGGGLLWPVLLFTLALVAGLVRGVASGGNLNVALWEARSLFYVVICYLLAANTVRTRRHVQWLMAVTVGASGLFALEGAYRKVVLIDGQVLDVPKDFLFAHDTVVFLGTLIVAAIAQQTFGAARWQRLAGLLLVPLTGYTLLATERRAGYIGLVVALLACALVFLVAHRKAFFLFSLPLLIGGAIYLPLFWNNTGLAGQPARAVRSLTQPDPRDAASNYYRVLETHNVRTTILANPVLGVGFGQPFYFVVPLPSLAWWPFWHYEPHNNVLWVWLKTGAGGFIVFWTLMGTAVARAAFLVKTLRLPETRAFALVAMNGIIGALTFSYVDLGLVSGRITVFLGTLLGVLAVLDRLEGEETSPPGPLSIRDGEGGRRPRPYRVAF